MPYPNEHACSKASKKWARCFRKAVKDDKKPSEGSKYEPTGKGYIALICYDENENSQVASFRYPKGSWSAEEARAHCKAHQGGTFEAAREAQEFTAEEMLNPDNNPMIRCGSCDDDGKPLNDA